MRNVAQRLLMPALLLLWVLSQPALSGGEAKTKKTKVGKRAPTIEEIRQALDQPVTLDFSGQSLLEALQHLRQKAGVDINLDQLALVTMGINVQENGGQPITMVSAGGKLRTALRKLLSTYQLTYVIFEDSILITTPDLAVQRQMRQRVNIDVTTQPLAKVLRELARNYAFNLVVDPNLGGNADAVVSLTLDGTTLETGVRLLAEMAELKAIRLDNVMFITTQKRADQLRKEDKDSGPSGLDLPAAAAQLGLNGMGGVMFNGQAFLPVPPPPMPEPLEDPPAKKGEAKGTAK